MLTQTKYRVAKKKKYSSLIQYNLKSKRVLTLKQLALYSLMYNLNFGIYNLHFNTVLSEITAFKVELTFLQMLKMSKKRPIKCYYHNKLCIGTLYGSRKVHVCFPDKNSLGNACPAARMHFLARVSMQSKEFRIIWASRLWHAVTIT